MLNSFIYTVYSDDLVGFTFLSVNIICSCNDTQFIQSKMSTIITKKQIQKIMISHAWSRCALMSPVCMSCSDGFPLSHKFLRRKVKIGGLSMDIVAI